MSSAGGSLPQSVLKSVVKIAGIDPGSRKAGFAILQVRGPRVEIIEMGVWNLVGLAPLKEKSLIGDRLEILHELASEFLRKHNPQFIGFEKAVSFKNIESAHKLSEARGVIRLAVHQNLQGAAGRLLELSPTAVKRQTTGTGLSDKAGMLKALSLRFANIGDFVADDTPFDAYDALGVAWTTWVHYKQNLGFKSRVPIKSRPRGSRMGSTGEGHA